MSRYSRSGSFTSCTIPEQVDRSLANRRGLPSDGRSQLYVVASYHGSAAIDGQHLRQREVRS